MIPMTDETESLAATLGPKGLERNVVSCMLNSPEIMNSVDLPPAAFEGAQLRTAYAMIIELRAAGHEEVTINTLRHFYDARTDFQAVVNEHGGWKFLELMAQKPDFANFKLHLSELEARHEMRTLQASLGIALTGIRDGRYKSRTEILSALDTAVEAQGTALQEHEVIQPGMFNREWLKQQSEKFIRGDFKNTGINIPFPLDAACGRRWCHGSLNVWAGETNVGKSFLIQMLISTFTLGEQIPTLILDNEMSQKQFYDRLLSRETGLESYKFQDGSAYNPTDSAYVRVEEHLDRLESMPLTWVEFYELKIHKIEAQVRKFIRKYPKEQYPNKMLLVDGLKIDGDGDSFWSVGFLAQSLKLMTRKYATEGLVTHVTTQLNRGGASKSRGKEQGHPTHLDVGLSKLIPDNADDFYILLHHFTHDDEDNKTFSKEARRLVCTKARDHQTLEGTEYLLMDFNGSISRLVPNKVESTTAKGGTPGGGQLPLDASTGL